MKNLKLVFLTLFLLVSLSSIWSVDYTWIGGGAGNWSDPANWISSPAGGYPDDATDTATINDSSDISMTENITIGNLYLTEWIWVDTFLNDFTVTGTVLDTGTDPSTNADGFDKRGAITSTGGTITLGDVNGLSYIDVQGATSVVNITTATSILNKLKVKTAGASVNVGSIGTISKLEFQDLDESSITLGAATSINKLRLDRITSTPAISTILSNLTGSINNIEVKDFAVGKKILLYASTVSGLLKVDSSTIGLGADMSVGSVDFTVDSGALDIENHTFNITTTMVTSVTIHSTGLPNGGSLSVKDDGTKQLNIYGTFTNLDLIDATVDGETGGNDLTVTGITSGAGVIKSSGGTIALHNITSMGLIDLTGGFAHLAGTFTELKANNTAVFTSMPGDDSIGYDLTVSNVSTWAGTSYLRGPLDEVANTEANLSLSSTSGITIDIREMFNNITLGSNVDISTAQDLTIYGTLTAPDSTITSTATWNGFSAYNIASLDTLVVDDLVLGKRTGPTTYLQDGSYNIGTFTKNGTGGVHIGASTLNITGSSNTFDISSNDGTLILNSGTLNLVDIHINSATISDPWVDQTTTSTFTDIYLLTNTAIIDTATKGLSVTKSIYGDGKITSTDGVINVTDNVSLDTLTVGDAGADNPVNLIVGLDSNITNLSLTSINFSPGENLYTGSASLNSSSITVGNGNEFVVTGTYVDVASTINAGNSRISINSATILTTLNLGSNTNFYLTGNNQTVNVTTLNVGTDTEFDINNNTLNLDNLTGTPIINSSGGAVDMGTTGSADIKGSFKDIVAVGNITYVGDVELIGAGGDIEAGAVDSNNFKTTISGNSTIIGTTIDLTDLHITPTGTFILDNNINVSGNWNNEGTFTNATFSVTFDDNTKDSNISGDSTFNSFICNTPGKNLIFEAGSTQTITTFNVNHTDTNNAISLLSSIPGSEWFLINTGTFTTRNLLVSDSNATGSANEMNASSLGFASYDGGGNTYWFAVGSFSGQNTWLGGEVGFETRWDRTANWSNGVIPDRFGGENADDRAVIPTTATFYPVLTGTASAYRLMIASGGVLDTAGQTIEVGASLRNQGTIRMTVGSAVTDGASSIVDSGSGTVEFYGAVANTSAWTGDFFNLVVNTTGAIALDQSRVVGGYLNILQGSLNIDAYNLTIVGDITSNIPAGITATTGQVIIGKSGAGSSSYLNSPLELKHLTINESVHSLTLGGALTISGNIINNGSFYINNNKVTFNGDTTISGTGSEVTFGDIDITGILKLSNNIKVGGDWNNTGTFTVNTSIVEFVSGLGSSTLYGNNTFLTLNCYAPGKVLIFESNTTQTISDLNLKGSEAGLITLKPTDYLLGNFTLNITGGTASVEGETVDASSSVDYVDVTSSSLSGNSIDADYHSIDSGGNDISTPDPKWVFRKDIFIWNGSENSLWANVNNWEKTSDPGNPVLFLPGATDWVQIPNTVNKPIITTAISLKSMNIAADAIVNLGAGASVTLTYFSNNGTIKITDNGATINKIDTDSGTVEFTGITDISSFWSSYYNLKIGSGASTSTGPITILNDFILEGDLSVSNNITVGGDFYFTSGILTSNNNITVNGDWITVAGIFSGTNTVFFPNTSSIIGETTFINIEVSAGGILSLNNDIEVNDISILGTINAGSYIIAVNKDWINSGTFNRGTGIVEFLAGVGASTVTGDTIFNILKCISPGKAINFTAGSIQSFYDLDITGTSGNLIVLNGAANWSFTNLKGSEAQVSYVSIFYGQVTDSGATGSIRALSSLNDGNTDIATGTSFWIIDNTARELRWQGTTSDWTTISNWYDIGLSATALAIPTSIDTIIIPDASTTAVDPIVPLDADPGAGGNQVATVEALTIELDGILDASTNDLIVNGNFENSGILKRSGLTSQNINKTDINSGRVIYETASIANIQLYTGVDYFDLEVTGDNKTLTADMEIAGDLTITATTVDFTTNTTTLTLSGTQVSSISGNIDLYNLEVNKDSGISVTLSSGINIGNDLNINQGTMNLGAGTYPVTVDNNINIISGILQGGDAVISLKGSWDNGGTNLNFVKGTSTVLLLDSSKISFLKGDNDFYKLSCIIPNKTIKFISGSTQKASNDFTISGGTGTAQIDLISSLSGTQWNLEVTGTASVQNINLRDSYLSGGNTITVTGDSNNLGNNKDTLPDPFWDFVTSVLFTWTDGGVAGIWTDPNNWDQATAPDDPTHDILIPVASITNFPVLSADVDVKDLTIEAGASLSTKDFDITIAGNITNNGTLYRWGGTGAAPQNISKVDTTNSGVVIYNGALDRNIQYYAGGYKNLTINNNTKTALNEITLVAGGTLTVEDGAILDLNTRNLTITTAGNYYAGTTGTGKLKLDGTGAQTVTGLVVTPGTDIVPGTVEYTGLVTALKADYKYSSLLFSGTGAVSFPSALSVAEDLIINSTITTVTPAAGITTKDLELYGTAELRMTTYNLLVTGTTNAVATETVGKITSTTGTQEFQGIFKLKDLKSSDTTTTFKGTSVNISGEIAAYTVGNVIFDGVTTLSSPTQTFFNVEHKDAGILSVTSDLDIDGNLIITAGTVDLNKVDGVYSIAGDVTGPAAGTGILDVATQTSGSLTLNNVGNVSATSLLTFNSPSGGATPTITVSGNWDVDSFTSGGSTISFIGGDTTVTSNSQNLGNIIINKTLNTNTLTLQDALNSGNLTITKGVLTTGTNSVDVTGDISGVLTDGTISDEANVISFTGNWNVPGFSDTTGTVEVKGASASISEIDGANTFNLFKCVAAGKVIKFKEGVTQTITDLLLTGAVADYIVLDSIDGTSTWTFDNQSGGTLVGKVTYVEVWRGIVDTNTIEASYTTNRDGSSDNGLNDNHGLPPYWDFMKPTTYYWRGTTDTSWNTVGNWEPTGYPVSRDSIILDHTTQSITNNLEIVSDRTVVDFTITEAAALSIKDDAAQHTLTTTGDLLINDNTTQFTINDNKLVAGGTFNNEGTIIRNAAGVLHPADATSGTVEYVGTGPYVIQNITYWNIKSNLTSGVLSTPGDISVNSAFSITSGSFKVDTGHTLTLSGTNTVSAGVVDISGTVSAINSFPITGTGQLILNSGILSCSTLPVSNSSGTGTILSGTGSNTINTTLFTPTGSNGTINLNNINFNLSGESDWDDTGFTGTWTTALTSGVITYKNSTPVTPTLKSNNLHPIYSLAIEDGVTLSAETGSHINIKGDITGSTGVLTGNDSTFLINGKWDLVNFTHGTSSVEFDTAQTITTGKDHTFYNLKVVNSSTLTVTDSVTVNKDLTIATGNTLSLVNADLILYGHNTDSAGAITGSAVNSQVYHRGGTLSVTLLPFNFDNLTLDLHIDDNSGDNDITLSTDFSITTSGNIIFDDVINGTGSNSLIVSSPTKDITFNAAIGNVTPIGLGAAASPFSVTGTNIEFKDDVTIAATGNTSTLTGAITLTNASFSSGSHLQYAGAVAINSTAVLETITTTDSSKNITLEAAVTTNKPLTINSSGDINLNGTSSITSTTSSNPLILEAVGNIVDGTATENALVIADTITLKSTGGSVGLTGVGDIEVDVTTVVEASSVLGGVFVTQVADRDINLTYIKSTNGNIEITNEASTAGNGDIFIDSGALKGIVADTTDDVVTILTVNGAIAASNTTTTGADTEVEAFNITMTSGGVIGSNVNNMDINAVGELNLSGSTEAWIYDRTGDLPLNVINISGVGAVTRIYSSGNITQVPLGSVTSEKLLFGAPAASKSIGTILTPINTVVTNLEAYATSNVYITESDDLIIGGVSGAIGITATGGQCSIELTGLNNSLTVNEKITSGWNLYLSTNKGDLTLDGDIECNEILDISTGAAPGAGNLTINNPILNHGDGIMTFDSGDGITTLNNNISSDCATPGVDTKKITFVSPVQLGGAGTYIIETTLPGTIDLDVEFTSTVDNAGSLVINAGLGYVDFNGVIGGSTAISALNVNSIQADLSGINNMTGSLTIVTPTTNGVVLLEGSTYNVTGTVDITAGNRVNVAPNRGGIFINAPAAMAITSGGFTATGTTTTYLYGASSANSVTFTNGFIFNDLHISLPGKTLSINGAVTANNIVLYDGDVNLNGNTLNIVEDLVLLGAAYNHDDSVDGDAETESGVAGVFKYDPSASYTRQVAVNTEVLTSFISGYDPSITPSSPYSGSFSNLVGSTISVGNNFYNNGADMLSAGAWTLTIPDNNDATVAFAEAYNMSVQNCNVTSNYKVAASENVTATASPDWATTQPTLDTGVTGIHTVYDDIIKIYLTSGSFENDNNEISAAIASGLIQIDGGTVSGASLGSYIDDPATPAVFDLISTDGEGDLSVFYLKAENAIDRWNTDADGTTLGAANSTDRGRLGVAPVHRTTVPNIDIAKCSGTIYFSLLDSNKNRIEHRVDGVTTRIIAVKDKTKPVITSVVASKHGTSGDSVDSHNYFEITYSEPVQYAVNSGTSASFVQNTRSSTTILDTSTDGLGEIDNSAGTVTVKGLFSYAGNFVSGNFSGVDNTNTLYSVTPNKLRIDIVAYHDGTKWPGYLGSTATNIDNYVKITNPSSSFIHGDFNGDLADLRSVYAPAGAEPNSDINTQLLTIAKSITVISNPDISDSATVPNVIEDDSDNYEGTAYFKASMTIGGTGWDVFPPYISRLSSTTALNPIYEIYFMDELITVGDRIVDNIGFLILDDHVMQPYWDSRNGWTKGTTSTGIIPNPLGGIRDFDPVSITSTMSLVNFQAFNYGIKDSGTYTNTDTLAGSTNVLNNILSQYTTTINAVNDPYFSISFTPSNSWILKDLLSMSYDSTAGRITDLSGNLMPSSVSVIDCFQWIPPEIILALAEVGSKSVYIQFSKGVYSNSSATAGITINNLMLAGSSNSITNITSVNGVSGLIGEDEFVITLAQPLSANDMVNAEFISNPAQLIYDSVGFDLGGAYNRRISDLGIGLITLFAEDSMHKDNNLLEDGALREFDGNGKLLPEDIIISAKVNGDNNQSFTLDMLYAVNPDLSSSYDYDPSDNVYSPNLWLEEGLPESEQVTGVFKFTGLSLTTVNTTGAVNGFRQYPISNSDSNIQAGNELQFIFRLDTTIPLFCVNIPEGGSTLSDLKAYEVALSEIRRQRGGVTIINNVINPLDGNKTELLLDQDKPGMCTIVVFSLDGNIVKKLHSGRQSAGTYRYQWDGTNNSGTPVARGVYFIKVVAPGIDESRKVMIVK